MVSPFKGVDRGLPTFRLFHRGPHGCVGGIRPVTASSFRPLGIQGNDRVSAVRRLNGRNYQDLSLLNHQYYQPSEP